MIIDGKPYDVPGVRMLRPGEESWNKLARYGTRTRRPQFKIIHKVVADDPETDPAEAQIMQRMGATSLVMAGSKSDQSQQCIRACSSMPAANGKSGAIPSSRANEAATSSCRRRCCKAMARL